MLLSDRDIRAELDAGRVILDPYDPDMVQPASIDVRLDRWFRLFDNHRYPAIDPAAPPMRASPFPTTSPPAWRASPAWGAWAC